METENELPGTGLEGAGTPGNGTEPEASETPEALLRESLEKERKELEQEKAALRMEQQRIEARKLLDSTGLPETFLPFVLREDMGETKAAVQEVKLAFDEAVQKQVEIRMVGRTPQAGNGIRERNYLADEVRNALR